MLAFADALGFLGFLAGFDAEADADAFADADAVAAVAVGAKIIDAEDMTNPATNDVNTVRNFLFMVKTPMKRYVIKIWQIKSTLNTLEQLLSC